MTAPSAPSATGWLIPVAGPPLRTISLIPKSSGLVLGRQESCDVRLPNEAVSRSHARLTFEKPQWRLTDLNSRWGTFVNGVKVASESGIPLRNGDLVRINPWTFNFTPDAAQQRGIDSINDVERFQTMVHSIEPRRGGAALPEELLALLLESAAALHDAADETALANVLVDAAIRGTNLPNAAVLRPVDADGRIAVIISREASGAELTFSRSLITAASSGVVSAFIPSGAQDISQSIISLQINAALCVPLMLGNTVAAYLYLDSRGGRFSPSPGQWSATSGLCLALGRIASLALANLKRIDIERRTAQMEADVKAAAEAQRFLLPRRDLSCGPFKCSGESRPGRYVGGDFFDLIPLRDGKLALALGDVSGKGIGASVLMTTAHGFLHASLAQGAQPEAAVLELNRFLAPRIAAGRFITLWVALFDPAARTLRYVDAGHGYAYLLTPGGAPQRLDRGGNVPVGVLDSFAYTPVTIPLPAEGQLLVVSDGIIEQPASVIDADRGSSQYVDAGFQGLLDNLLSQDEPLSSLMQSVTSHAGTTSLADDATALIVRWR